MTETENNLFHLILSIDCCEKESEIVKVSNQFTSNQCVNSLETVCIVNNFQTIFFSHLRNKSCAKT